MNKKGFTIVELLSVLVVLSLIFSFGIVSINKTIKGSKEKSMLAFVETIKDAMDVYLSGNEKRNLSYTACANNNDYENAVIIFKNVMQSTYEPMKGVSLVNPANKKKCDSSATVKIYRNKNYSYFYEISAVELNCDIELDGNKISNLPEGFSC